MTYYIKQGVHLFITVVGIFQRSKIITMRTSFREFKKAQKRRFMVTIRVYEKQLFLKHEILKI